MKFPKSLAALGYTEEELDRDNPFTQHLQENQMNDQTKTQNDAQMNDQTKTNDKPEAVESALARDLDQFTGTAEYHRWSLLFNNFVLTDGVNFLAGQAGAYWLVDAIASHIGSYKDEGFAVARLTKELVGWTLTIDDGNDNILASQEIEYSDFPLDEITLFVAPQESPAGTLWVIMLPSEY